MRCHDAFDTMLAHAARSAVARAKEAFSATSAEVSGAHTGRLMINTALAMLHYAACDGTKMARLGSAFATSLDNSGRHCSAR